MPGPFHRLESGTQTVEVAELQLASGEIWGGIPRGGMCPTVQAYPRELVAGRRGVQFDTPVSPEATSSPLEARWYLGITAGVAERMEAGNRFASIEAQVQNFQPRV